MIGFALPWILGVAAAGVLAISALHLLSVRRPPELVLPTARFLPERDVRAVSRTRKPSDVLLLAVRIGALLAAGLAAAIPAWTSRARENLVIVVADRGIVRDTVAMRALVPAGAASRVVFVRVEDSVNPGTVVDPAALIPVAWRAASQSTQRNASIDSVDLHLLLSSAPARDAGLAAWRSAWPGRVTTHYPAAHDISRRVVVVDASEAKGGREPADDDVRAAFGWHASRVSRAGAARIDTVILSRASEADAGGSNGIRVSWPISGVPANWRAATGAQGAKEGSSADSASALALSGRALIGPFPVAAVFSVGDAAAAKTDTSVSPIAWWSDGRVAATERRRTSGCDRSVPVVTDPASDILLSTSANALFDRLLAPCEHRVSVEPSTLSVTDVKDGSLADAAAFRGAAGGATARSSWIVPFLFALSLLLLLVEWRLRTRALAGAA